ncbi:hypothetical protein [Nocardia cyriacigeorgica]|uniref:hypothetical protein n=1 Tax=Nocardia cyriacigeorgica TaxID=135487 RepID=UPI000CEA60FE|nr:hypothetical protein [Nocardia cyriacigeorgica]PPJ14997.1 hypothetical protein C5E43_05645 [Nocardia cyriacigeorgica]
MTGASGHTFWNAARGAGHGQNRFGIEAFDPLHHIEYEPGRYRSVPIPDPTFVTELIDAASPTLWWATVRWLFYAG